MHISGHCAGVILNAEITLYNRASLTVYSGTPGTLPASVETATTGTPLATWTFAEVAFPSVTFPATINTDGQGNSFVSITSHALVAPTQNPVSDTAGYARAWVWAWTTGIAIAAGSYCFSGGNLYYTAAGGTTGASAPTATSGSASDGAVTWAFVQTANNGSAGHAIADLSVNTSNADIPVGTTTFTNGAGVTISTATLSMPVN